MKSKGLQTIDHQRLAWLVAGIAGSIVWAQLALGRQRQPRPDFPDGEVQRDVVYKPIASAITSFFDKQLKTGGSH